MVHKGGDGQLIFDSLRATAQFCRTIRSGHTTLLAREGGRDLLSSIPSSLTGEEHKTSLRGEA